MASDDWYAALDGEQAGPFPRPEMERLIAEGRIDRDTLVWTEGMADWMPAGSTPLLAEPDTGSVPGADPSTGPAAQAAGPTSVPHVAAPARESASSEGAPSGPDASVAPPDALSALRGATFGQAVTRYFARYVTFSGRASRAEYWWAMLFVALGTLAFTGVDAVTLGAAPGDPAVLSSLFGLVTLLPTLAVSVRRLHDIDRSGWWILIAFVPIVGFVVLVFFHLQRGTDGPNRFGTFEGA